MASSNQAQVAFHTDPLRALAYPAEFIDERRNTSFGTLGSRRSGCLLKDGDLIDLGDIRLEVVHCPGHTPGHVAYYWRRQGVLFTGMLSKGMGLGREATHITSTHRATGLS